MKKIIIASVAILGVSVSLVQANNSNFLDSMNSRLFSRNTISPSEQVLLLSLSSEAPRSTIKVKTERVRRNYKHLKLKKRAPFYTKRINRVVDEASIGIVKRKDRVSREKSLRYRTMFASYGL